MVRSAEKYIVFDFFADRIVCVTNSKAEAKGYVKDFNKNYDKPIMYMYQKVD